MICNNYKYLINKGILKLLEIKDSDIRIATLEQCRNSVDRGLHVGGAFSATIPLVALFYGSIMNLDVSNPTGIGQDMFVLSKGHAVAAMASIYADLGYFDRFVLNNSRSADSILNGHPGPILPGVQISTGPLGQGLGVAQGFAMIGKKNPGFDVFCMTGDGELQEGIIWESLMYSSYMKLDNLCVIVDKNNGQLDDPKHLIFPMTDLDKKFKAFGWNVLDVDSMQYEPVLEALKMFKFNPKNGKPTAVICNTIKGYGGFSEFMIRHKVVLDEELTNQELLLQTDRRQVRSDAFIDFYSKLKMNKENSEICEELASSAKSMNLLIQTGKEKNIKAIHLPVKTKMAPIRNKKIKYELKQLPVLDPAKEYSMANIITSSMKIFARDNRVVSIDSDLASASGLEAGIAYVDRDRAFNAGVAEANMMLIGEAFAAMGYNAWVSTFCPFFDWKVLRRIAVGYQERLESIEKSDGWLDKGHGLDLTFVATAPNFETLTNGATHMGNDDMHVFGSIAHVKIIDASCPNQLLGIMKWIMEGNRGLVYLRILRSQSKVIYRNDFAFEYNKGYVIKESNDDKSVVVTSGRGVHEALKAYDILEKIGIKTGIVDMSSIDEKLFIELYKSGKKIIIAEQNNGYIRTKCMEILFKSLGSLETGRIILINTLDKEGKPQFIHSASYNQLLNRFGLSGEQIAETIKRILL